MPFLLQHLLDQTEPPWKGYVYIVVIVVSALLASIHYYQAGFQAWSLAAKVRSVLIILTYKKSLRVQAASGKDTGRIVNMVGTDAQCVLELCIKSVVTRI
jgi:ATP-binding cassette subfamily C (CFTR/MRP) protein 1